MAPSYQTRNYPVGPPEPSTEQRRRLALKYREALLARSALFDGVSKGHLRAIARATTAKRYNAGEEIVTGGDEGSTFYAIVEGKTKVVRGGRTLTRLGGGDFFGEIAILDPGPRAATVIAEDATLCLELGSRDFQAVLEKEPLLARRMLRTLARWLRQADKRTVS
jgi:CRP-like cAMP-binding protein